MSQVFTAIILQLVCVAVLLLEIVIPSFGILTVLSAGLLATSWYFIVDNLSSSDIFLFAIVDLIAVPFLIYLGFRFFKYSPLTHKAELKKGSGLQSDISNFILVGKSGIVETDLHPFGKVNIEGNIYEVSSEGTLITKNTPIKVIQVQGLKITVAQITSTN